MSLRAIVLLGGISLGGSGGWHYSPFDGIMGSYLTAVMGASIGLYLGRKIQRHLDGD
ncbi:MAG: hypothetical protein KAU22_09760 [Desulfuromonadales bacterium]|nr:hypothetical protein [Desulfuromonadales bacterium]